MKVCVRCGGSIVLESDQFGAYEHCLMCGRVVNGPTPDPEGIAKLWDDPLGNDQASRDRARRKAHGQRPDVKARKRERARASRRRKREGGTG